MPIFKFDPQKSVIFCHAEIAGKGIGLSLKMAVDTGTTYTMIPVEAAVAIGCNPLQARRKIEITTGSAVEYVPLLRIPKLTAYGIMLKNLEVICHNLPPQSPIEGLLGLNFLKLAKLKIDFSANHICAPE
jgi:predicted aspartyl protease